MKVDVQDKANPTYPCIKRHTGSDCTVLFHAPKSGTVLVPSSTTSDSQLGAYDTNWQEQNFRLFYGSITLQND